MPYKVKLHPRAKEYIEKTNEKQRIKKSLKKLKKDPFRSRAKADIKKLKGKNKDIYRLRVGNHRFEYFVEDNTVWVDEAFKRERGYRN